MSLYEWLFALGIVYSQKEKEKRKREKEREGMSLFKDTIRETLP